MKIQKKQKRILISLLLLFILTIVLSGCSGVTGPKTAKINISFDPNPVPYPGEGGNWAWTLILTESNGMGVTLTNLRFDSYIQEQLVSTEDWPEDWITGLFDSNYLPASSSLQAGLGRKVSDLTHQILTVEGIDDSNNPIETSGRLDFLSQ